MNTSQEAQLVMWLIQESVVVLSFTREKLTASLPRKKFNGWYVRSTPKSIIDWRQR